MTRSNDRSFPRCMVARMASRISGWGGRRGRDHPFTSNHAAGAGYPKAEERRYYKPYYSR